MSNIPLVEIFSGDLPDPLQPATFDARAFPATQYAYVDLPADINATVAAINAFSAFFEETSGLANYRGNWADLTGALAIPASVFHEGNFWVLLEDVADVTASEPGVDPEWGSVFVSAELKDYSVAYENKGNSGSGTVTVNWNDGNYQRIVRTGNFTLAFSNIPASGTYAELQIEAEDWGAGTVTFPTINWVNFDGSVVTTFAEYLVDLQSDGVDFFVFWTRDGGTTLYGKVVR